MAQTSMDGFPAFDAIRYPAMADGGTVTTKLSTAENVQITVRDASYTLGTANFVSYSLSGQTITLVVKGYTAGTADVLVLGRL